MQQGFLNYINVFRAIAILLIVSSHTMVIGLQSNIYFKIVTGVLANCTILFIFIAGFLFKYLSENFDYKKYLFKKWKNIILPYIFTSIPGLLFCFYTNIHGENPFENLNKIIQIPILLTIGCIHNPPTWFIPFITLIFISSVVLLRLENKPVKNFLYKCLPFLLLVNLLFRLQIHHSNNLFIEYYNYLTIPFAQFLRFMFVFVFGMYCAKNMEIIDKFYKQRYLLLFLTVLYTSLNIYLWHSHIWYNETVPKIFLTMLILGYLKHYNAFFIAHKKINTVLDFIAKYSFGIFFIHWYWILIFNKIFSLPIVAPIYKTNPLLSVFIIFSRFFTVFILSIITLYILKTILLKINPKLNTRMFIGV